ncbi:MAG: hypothetical protein AAGF31_07540 [Planctomycetota bacterium]
MVAETIRRASHLTADELAALAEAQEGTCVSIYLPTHRMGKEIRQDPIRLKNRVSDAESKLDDKNADADGVRAALQELEPLTNLDADGSREFWRHQEDGLAILVADGKTHVMKLAVDTPETTVVANRFHIRPLIKAASRDGEYGVVAVSRNGVRFLEGSKRGLSETEIEDLPESLQAVVGGDEQKGFNLHSFQDGGRANGEEAVPHGHVDKDEFEALKRYFGEIAEAVHEAMRDDPRPVIFAGVDELFPYFKDACEETSLDLVDGHVAGNPDGAHPDELHEKAWPLVEKRLGEKSQALIAQFEEQQHTDLVCTDLEAIVKAAKNGRVDTLLVTEECRPLGSYDPTQQRVQLDEAEREEGIDLADLAAAATLANSVKVHVVAPEHLKFADGEIAALLRYTA